jgi:hypothetical protein
MPVGRGLYDGARDAFPADSVAPASEPPVRVQAERNRQDRRRFAYAKLCETATDFGTLETRGKTRA